MQAIFNVFFVYNNFSQIVAKRGHGRPENFADAVINISRTITSANADPKKMDFFQSVAKT